jgi:hypothetical protein
MLEQAHDRSRYPKSVFIKQRSRVSFLCSETGGSLTGGGVSQSALGDSEGNSLEEFCKVHMSDRDELAYRKLRGDSLTDREEAKLATLNATLERLLPTPEEMPSDVEALMREADLLMRR